eukprot:gnl/MRDRNA2_/MRDRNA2_186463_c0_seq1.p1 gnl/MRDRNA2_/MRDRNA2_186463_c0~~gnl/MRDRNA2_/MRDRNA2_186463_c0_seq1.p1  ORF type:complete len:441 (+),score=73.81 gnl/MRDRNA2_/MRDRNA2_186463_c0_seq1:31-1323(+)
MEGILSVTASTLSGATHCVEVNVLSTKVQDLKTDLATALNILAHEQDIIFEQRVLEDHNLIAEYGIRPGSTTVTVVRLQKALACTASADGVLKLWNLEHGDCVRTLQIKSTPGRGGISAVDVDWTSMQALCRDVSGTITYWNLWTGTCLWTVCGSHMVMIVNWILAQALCGLWDGAVKLYDIKQGTCVTTLQGHEGYVNQLEVSWSTMQALSGSGDGTLKLWNLASEDGFQDSLGTLWGHDGGVTKLDTNWDQMQALSGSGDGALKLWNLVDATCLQTMDCADGYVSALSVDWPTMRALVGSEHGQIQLWDLFEGTRTLIVEGRMGDTMQDLEANWKTMHVLTICAQGQIHLWNLDGKKKKIRTLEKENGTFQDGAVAVDWSTMQVLAGSDTGDLELWNLITDQRVRTLTGHLTPISAVATNWKIDFSLP